jgi:C4-dicarboxylate transporter/malic acid transport protein
MPGLHAIAEGLWWFTIGLFILFSGLYAARWLMFFHEARRIFGHSTVSMFFGTIPMGLATILNGLLLFGLPRWGGDVIPLAESLWWLDVAMALACGVLIPFMMFTRQEHSIDQMTAVWLLPVVAAEVAAASGGLLAPHLADAHSQLIMLVTSYVLWAFSLPVAFSILTILMLRMALHKLPHANMAASSWLALGPIGTGALGMLLLGGDAPAIFAANGLPGVGEMANGLGLVAGITLWGFGLWWMLIAVLITLRYLRAGIPFNLGWWGFTFPLGVYALATLKLASLLQLGFFGVFGCVLVMALTLMWLIVAKRTVQGAYKGELFVSPCIAGLANK